MLNLVLGKIKKNVSLKIVGVKCWLFYSVLVCLFVCITFGKPGLINIIVCLFASITLC